MLIKDFSGRKVSDYLASGRYRKVMIKFHHGLGDAIAFQPCFDALRGRYPDVDFYLHVHCGQDDIFGTCDENESAYDIVFEIGFPCSEWDHPEMTKAEYCCRSELGIPPPSAPPHIDRRFSSPLVGVHYHSTCLPGKLGCSEFVAKRLRDQIIDAGLIPLDTHMSHYFDNPDNRRFGFEHCTIREARATCANLLGVLSVCSGFAGVASGNFHAALALLPVETVLFLKTDFPASRLTRRSVLELDVNNYDESIVNLWLDRVKRGMGR